MCIYGNVMRRPIILYNKYMLILKLNIKKTGSTSWLKNSTDRNCGDQCQLRTHRRDAAQKQGQGEGCPPSVPDPTAPITCCLPELHVLCLVSTLMGPQHLCR